MTAISGLPAASASPLPASRATITPPISPGPAVAATASTSSMDSFGVVEHAPDQAGKNLDVRARRDLRHHAAVRLVRAVLADDRLREDLPVAGDQCRRAVVAGRFKAQEYNHFAPGPLPDPRLMH